MGDRDIEEIIDILGRARTYLVKALDKLDEVSTYSILDVFLGGPLSLVADALEYSKFSEAKAYVEEAGSLLKKVREKINEANLSIPEIDHTTLWAVLDIGLDGLLIDLIRHFKISQAKEKLGETIKSIDRLIRKLRDMVED